MGENLNQYSGSKAGLEAKAVEGGMYVRIDMPGVEKEDVEVWMEDKTVFFVGEAKKQWEHEPSGRIYGGNIDLSSDSGEVTEVKTDVQNGVLRMVIDDLIYSYLYKYGCMCSNILIELVNCFCSFETV